MRIFAQYESFNLPKGSYIFLDNNILTTLYYNSRFLDGYYALFKDHFFIIDPYIRFEFLRNEFISEKSDNKIFFLKDGPFFPAIDHSEIHKTILDNATTLSKIYRHTIKHSPPPVDLFLMGRVMNFGNGYILTKDIDDFPAFLFDRLSVLSIEKESGALEHFQLIRFNQEKFSQRLDALAKIKPRDHTR